MWFKVRKGILYALMIALAITCMVPFYMMMVNATRNSQEIMSGFSFMPGTSLVENWEIMTGYFDIFRGLFNSIFVAGAITFLSGYFSALTAYGFAIYNFKGKNAIFTLMLVLMMVPGQLGLIGFYDLISGLGLIDSYIPLIIPAIASPFVVFFLRQYLQSVLPLTIVEAARIDGASELKIFHRIAIPIMMPGIATMSIGTFIGAWNSYILPLVVLLSPSKFTLPVMMGSLKASTDMAANIGATYLAIAISVLPIMIAFLFFSKHIISNISAGA
ncbi:MAG: carbohydrate ABC transporter permease, partial [Culicoidibacterales bacterium]